MADVHGSADGPASAGPAPPVRAVILDLDGLILDTESLCVEVAREVVARHGRVLTPEAHRVALGRRPLECWSAVAKVLDLAVPPEQLLAESEPLMAARWADARLLPGALRLVRHLAGSGLAWGVATSTPRATFNAKMSRKPELRALLAERPGAVVVCGDEVENGKPHPDVFLAVARALGVPPGECLALEDAPSGMQAATSAGMRVAVVPSLLGPGPGWGEPEAGARVGLVALLPSLLALGPTWEGLGLPPFADTLPPRAPGAEPHPGGGAIPVEPVVRIRGTVVKGFGRGSKELGIPTANVDRDAVSAALAEAVTGIYAGWARLGSGTQVYKTVMSIGYNPFFNNKEKTLEPWILHTFDKPFYGDTISLLVCAYVRPEANFTSLQSLVDRIHADADVARDALEHEPLAALKDDPFLTEAA
ncbi:hypothetical protein HYH03_014908 [Edaphochlamys debaryana]|uniref:riboflavin kinase n=1 Tax=Edaphochlamys debaryana TaxID=47281 RepID=A0A836BRI6_9CHLO|nr:hypothetical protein HYH03_014908 [Edaphochlamys debaryana]|eukprot:KAG2486461.1 hypothetical protein HYH03_014908 [Edaphochlamys debaryana]